MSWHYPQGCHWLRSGREPPQCNVPWSLLLFSGTTGEKWGRMETTDAWTSCFGKRCQMIPGKNPINFCLIQFWCMRRNLMQLQKRGILLIPLTQKMALYLVSSDLATRLPLKATEKLQFVCNARDWRLSSTQQNLHITPFLQTSSGQIQFKVPATTNKAL